MLLTTRGVFAAVATLSLVGLTGCVEWESEGPSRTEPRSVELDKSEMVHVELKMGAGELNVRGGSSKLMDADFHYTRPSLRPNVRYDSSGFRGHLVVEESHGLHGNHSGNYRWDVRLNDEKPMDLQVDFGAGEGHLDVGSLTLRSLDVHMGVGNLRIDLRGTPKNDYNVSVHGGVGEATIYLPSGVGVIADAKGGIGGVNARGLEKRDDRYVNEEYGHSKTTIRLDVRGGIGTINLIGS
ncbi:MAG TPA: toast rack family protein [Bryobacteraceae bacterium]|jgi:hypothetical protein|nr:toast rack family protein [Bryobacteraceae bacterium]